MKKRLRKFNDFIIDKMVEFVEIDPRTEAKKWWKYRLIIGLVVSLTVGMVWYILNKIFHFV